MQGYQNTLLDVTALVASTGIILTFIHYQGLIPTHLAPINTLRPRQETNGYHFPDAIFKCIFLNENVWISPKLWLKFDPKFQINNIPAMSLTSMKILANMTHMQKTSEMMPS